MSVLAERAALAAPRDRSQRRRTARTRAHSPLRDRLEYGVIRAAAGILGVLPLGLALRVGEAVAFFGYLLDRRHRRIGMRNLAIAFPEKPLAERRRILRASLFNLGRTVAEIAHLPRLTDEDLREMVRFADEEWWHSELMKARATGALILSGHFGNWELLVYAHGRRGFPVYMVHRTLRNGLIDRWFNAVRARAGTRLVRKSHATKDVLRALRERGLLVMPFDQNSTRGLGTFVDFFGLPASTNTGIARVALRAGVPVAPVFIVRQGRGSRHVVHALPLLHLAPSGDMEGDVQRYTQQLSVVFEEMVRRYPEQWLWVHRRWKTRPHGEPRFY